MAAEQRIIVRIEISQDAKDGLNALTDKLGMTQVALTSRVLEWFARQPDLIQAAVLGHYPEEIQADVARLVMKRMSDKLAVATGRSK